MALPRRNINFSLGRSRLPLPSRFGSASREDASQPMALPHFAAPQMAQAASGPSLNAVGVGEGGSSGGGGASGGSSGEDWLNALLSAANAGHHDTGWINQFRDQIIGLAPQLNARFGDPSGVFDPGYGGINALLIRSAVDPSTGPVYSRHGYEGGENDTAGLISQWNVNPAWATEIPAGQGNYDADGRYIGQKNGYIPGVGWVF